MSLKGKHKEFVVQKHLADRAGEHYDFRLEMPVGKKEMLVSWAIRKGPSLDPLVKRLALQTADHDLQYGNFEGVIEKGQYGAGKTIIWDKGTYKIIDPIVKNKEDLEKLTMFTFSLRGKKLKGIFMMIKTKRGWILRKKKDKYADTSIDITKDAPRSVKSGKKIEDVTKQDGYIDVVTSGYGID